MKTCRRVAISLALTGIVLSGCMVRPQMDLRQQSDGSAGGTTSIGDQVQQAAQIKESAPHPLVRFPEWPIPGVPPVDDKQSQVNAQPEQAPQPQQQSVTVKPPASQAKKSSKQLAKAAASRQSGNKSQLTLSQLVKKYPDLLLLKGTANAKKIALTFDDAPDTVYTPQVLDILKKYNVKATFFIVGRLAETHPEIVKRMVKEGHIIGNHSYNHSLLTKLTDEQYRMQITKTQKILNNTIGYMPKLVRPPYGEISESQLLWASEHNLLVVNWNVDSLDWKQLNQQQVTANVLNNARAGAIVLQHTGGGPNQDLSGTVNALPTIIESLQAKGYRLVTLPELLGVSKQL